MNELVRPRGHTVNVKPMKHIISRESIVLQGAFSGQKTSGMDFAYKQLGHAY